MFDLTTYIKKWRIRQLKTAFSALDTLCVQSNMDIFLRKVLEGLSRLYHNQTYVQEVNYITLH